MMCDTFISCMTTVCNLKVQCHSLAHAHASHVTLTHHTQAQKELEQLEQEINPALDDNAQVAFSFFLGKVVNAMAVVPDVSP